jgi:hypothetical protein
LFGKIAVGFSRVKCAPLSVEYAANQFALTNTTPFPTPPLGSFTELELIPRAAFVKKSIPGGSPSGAGCVFDSAEGGPGARKVPAGTGHAKPSFTTDGKCGFCGG